MGKRLIQQRRGRGKGRYKAPSHKYRGDIAYINEKEMEGVVQRIIHDPGRNTPVAEVKLSNNQHVLMIACEGMSVGKPVSFTESKKLNPGNVLPLGLIPEGYPIFNIELVPGDGGKLVRAGGSGASLVSHSGNNTVIRLPSGKFKTIDGSCRATIGIPAGGGRKDKPFLKAGKKFHARRRKGKQYPVVRGVAMNAVSHPHGGGNHQHVGINSSVSRSAPPGRKVGHIASKRTGKR